jgi:hypothetical protein
MKTRQDDIKQAVRLGARKIRTADIRGDLATVLLERFQIIKSAVEFVARDVTPEELSVAIIETFNEIDFERSALEPLARFCEGKLESETEQAEIVQSS